MQAVGGPRCWAAWGVGRLDGSRTGPRCPAASLGASLTSSGRPSGPGDGACRARGRAATGAWILWLYGGPHGLRGHGCRAWHWVVLSQLWVGQRQPLQGAPWALLTPSPVRSVRVPHAGLHVLTHVCTCPHTWVPTGLVAFVEDVPGGRQRGDAGQLFPWG